MAQKKDFSGIAKAFISTPSPAAQLPQDPAQESAQADQEERVEIRYVMVYQQEESKSRRLQLLIKPSTYEKIKALADANGTSVNNMINTILEEKVADNG